MPRIVFTLDCGSSHKLSHNVYGKHGRMEGNDAGIQLSLISENLRYFTADDGVIVFTNHISEARIED